MDIHIRLNRGSVLDCIACPDEDEEGLPKEFSSFELQDVLGRRLLGKGFTLEGVLRDVRLYLWSLRVLLPKYKITITTSSGECKKTLTYESPGRKEV